MKIALIQLNEINFSVVQKYIEKGYILNNLSEILENRLETIEDEKYENLEPWIQWPTLLIGKPFKEHKIFRLGDGSKKEINNLYTSLQEKLNFSCGAIAPMNISSKTANFDFFVPDPWSEEKFKGSFSLRYISEALKQGVNDNTGKGLTLKNKILLLIGLLFNIKIKDIFQLLKFFRKIKKKSFRKALFLDYILALLHINLVEKYKTNFSSVFFNAGAHIQHHYFFNSKVIKNKYKNPEWYISSNIDPILEALIFYNGIINIYKKNNFKIILSTGLQQVPYREKQFYYRLSNHKEFLKFLDIKFKSVLPRMTRDFELTFNSNEEKNNAKKILSQIKDESNELVFGEIDEREKSIFCSLTYKYEIKKTKKFSFKNKKFSLYNYVNFVAIKNGMHEKHGTFYISDFKFDKTKPDKLELHKVKELILKILNKENSKMI